MAGNAVVVTTVQEILGVDAIGEKGLVLRFLSDDGEEHMHLGTCWPLPSDTYLHRRPREGLERTIAINASSQRQSIGSLQPLV